MERGRATKQSKCPSKDISADDTAAFPRTQQYHHNSSKAQQDSERPVKKRNPLLFTGSSWSFPAPLLTTHRTALGQKRLRQVSSTLEVLLFAVVQGFSPTEKLLTFWQCLAPQEGSRVKSTERGTWAALAHEHKGQEAPGVRLASAGTLADNASRHQCLKAWSTKTEEPH